MTVSPNDMLSGLIKNLESALSNIRDQRKALDIREAKVREALAGLQEAAGVGFVRPISWPS